jgi:cytochrome c-type biogenesis protein CcmF
MDIQFTGEHLLPGKLGQFFIVLSIGASVLALISYFFATTAKDKLDLSWQKIGRIAYRLNLLAVVGAGACLFYIIYNHLFEYHYAWAHSSRTLPVFYIISCFWEGQEGSFWLWAFWQGVLGSIVIFKAKSWENSVMTVISLSQVFLTTMILGVEILGAKIGSTPFV